MQRQKAAGLVPEGEGVIGAKLEIDGEDEVSAVDIHVVLKGLLAWKGYR